MNMPPRVSVFLSAVFFLTTPLFAKEQHGAHEHGKAKLDIAVEGTKISVTFESPAESIYGFEHEAKTKSDIAARDSAAKILKDDALSLFQFDASLGCKMTSSQIEAWVKEDHDEDHDHHASKTAKPHKGMSHTKEAAHEHGEHSEVHANYVFTCNKAPSGTKLTVNLTNKFTRLREIVVQMISDQKQSGTTIKAGSTAVDL